MAAQVGGAFPKFTEQQFMQWLAFLLWCSVHKTTIEEELFSTHWLFHRPLVNHFFSWDEHRQIKAALHCQDDSKCVVQDVLDCEGRPVLKKIGVLMDHIQHYAGTSTIRMLT